jgi:hypothetical protein
VQKRWLRAFVGLLLAFAAGSCFASRTVSLLPGDLSRIHAVEKPRMDTNEHEFTNSNDDSAVCAAVTK